MLDAQVEGEPIQAVGGVLYRRRPNGQIQILLIKKREGFWTLPKGRVEPGETDVAALHRELREETGLCGQIEAAGEPVVYPIRKGRRELFKQIRYYLVLVKAGRLRLSKAERIERARWCTLRSALRRVRNPRVQSVVIWAAAQLQVPLAIEPATKGDLEHQPSQLAEPT